MIQSTMLSGQPLVSQEVNAFHHPLTEEFFGGTTRTLRQTLERFLNQSNLSSQRRSMESRRFLVLLLLVTMLRLDHSSILLELSKVSLFLQTRESKLKFSSNLVLTVVSIMVQFMLSTETHLKIKSSCLLVIGLPRSGVKS